MLTRERSCKVRNQPGMTIAQDGTAVGNPMKEGVGYYGEGYEGKPRGQGKNPAGKKAGKSATAAKTRVGATAKSQAPKKKAVAATNTKTAKGKGDVKKTPSLPHLKDNVLRQIIAKLDDMRSESVRVVNLHMHEDLKQREESGDVGDDMDQASSERDREFSLIIHQRHLRRLKQVDEAFERIDEGTYGLCEGTEEPIDPKRLMIMPLARFSIEYQQQQEKMLGRSPDEGIGMSDEMMISDE